jgi:hypothetical protein
MALGGAALCLPLTGDWVPSAQAGVSGEHPAPASPPGRTVLSPDDDQFLGEVEKASFLYFWEQGNPQTGLVKDRCNIRTTDLGIVASIVGTKGFGDFIAALSGDLTGTQTVLGIAANGSYDATSNTFTAEQLAVLLKD